MAIEREREREPSANMRQPTTGDSSGSARDGIALLTKCHCTDGKHGALLVGCQVY